MHLWHWCAENGSPLASHTCSTALRIGGQSNCEKLWWSCQKKENWRISRGHDKIVEQIKCMSQKESLLFGQTLIRVSRIRAKVPGVIAFDVLVLCDDRNLFSRLNVGNLDCFQRDGWVSKPTQVQDSNTVQAKVSLCCQHLSTYRWWKSALIEIGENKENMLNKFNRDQSSGGCHQ
jgi:uncharacterized protein YjhX (UPF0386 family)